MFALLSFLLAPVQAAIPASWDLTTDAKHRWVIQSDIALPGFMWLYADRNRDVRARAIGMHLVIDCTAQATTSNVGHLSCLVEDASFTGATFRSERGKMQTVLEEMDEKITGAQIALIMRPNGRVRTVKVVVNPLGKSVNQRTRATQETLRTLVVRATSAFDLSIPKSGFPEGNWPQFESRLMQLPTDRGTAGAGKLVHTAEDLGNGTVGISTLGKATLVDGRDLEVGITRYLDTTIAGFTVFDVAAGRVKEATWETVGEPTASSGLRRNIYAARSSLRALEPGEVFELGATREWTPDYSGQGALFPDDGSADAK